ncbi:uncharacterized protein LOC126607886 isoform X3 [Malus sylvestris]|uniref:uncharacterized protein LOC126607886 isoform X3 n=1 Tax=Malus sylvestris TaxID=3752 RepID=UPI0021AD11A0|nr:uncharacterized protein LOC126607886 isoform X3 [Malus sylvestris]
MPLSDIVTASKVPFAAPSLPNGNGKNHLPPKSYGNLVTRKMAAQTVSRNLKFVRNSASGDMETSSVGLDVSFPSDYSELIEQARNATELAVKDNKQLMEIEFPTSGLESVPGSFRQLIYVYSSFQFFPEANEVKFARESIFDGASFKLDYLTKPSFFEDFGFVEKVKMIDRVKPEDELFLAAYPYFNVTEMLVVEELYREAVQNTSRKLIIFNGELDRIRSGYYPPFFYPKLAALSKSLFPFMETVYYIHNFKGRHGGTLFRSYPGPWKVFRKVRNGYVCLHQQEAMPSLKEVALDILPSA